MCPACIATAALIVAGATSGGGLAALAMRKLRGTTGAGETDQTARTRQRDTGKDGVMPSHTVVSRRMGWRFTWVSSHGTDFNFDPRALAFTMAWVRHHDRYDDGAGSGRSEG